MRITDEMVEAYDRAWQTTAPTHVGARRRAGLDAALATVEVPVSQVVPDEDALDDLLSGLNEAGIEPVVAGLDADGDPFLAYGWSPGGDDWATGFVADDPHSREFDYLDGTERCDECGAFDRRETSKLRYPITVVTSS